MIPMPLQSGEAIMHTVRNGESLHSIARRYGVRAIDIRNLNNISFRSEGIQDGEQLIVARHIVQRKKAEEQLALSEKKKNQLQAKPLVAQEIKAVRPDGKTSVVKHTVKKGETLHRIATQYKAKVSNIMAENKLKNEKIQYGQILKITTPLDFAVKGAENEIHAQKAAPLRNAPASVEDGGSEENAEDEEGSHKPAVKPVIHKVKRGETLASIADLYKVKENQVKVWNHGKVRGSTVFLGTTLKIYPESSSLAASENAALNKKKADMKYYTIKSGDTLYSISKKFNVSIAELKNLNKMQDEDKLQIGQKIRLN
jgi:LysM repeat protein